jgi:hypothetical protein
MTRLALASSADIHARTSISRHGGEGACLKVVAEANNQGFSGRAHPSCHQLTRRDIPARKSVAGLLLFWHRDSACRHDQASKPPLAA